MNCPKCNSEMVLGYIQSVRGIYWGTEMHKLLMYPNFKKGDVWVGDEGFEIDSFRCPECGTIVIPPPNGGAENDMNKM
jgi:hypothetical protein